MGIKAETHAEMVHLKLPQRGQMTLSKDHATAAMAVQVLLQGLSTPADIDFAIMLQPSGVGFPDDLF